MKRVSLLIAAVVAVSIASAFAADEKSKLDGIKCPVADKAVKEDKTADYKGGKVYFCCGNCPEGFKKETAKFATKANAQLVATSQAKQAKCPLTGGDLNKDTTITVGGAKVTFCCKDCKGKVEAAKGNEQLEMAFSDKAFEKAGFKVEKKK